MPLTGNPSHDIPVELAAGKPREQAIAIAMSEKREHAHDDSVDEIVKMLNAGVTLSEMEKKLGIKGVEFETAFKKATKDPRYSYADKLRGDAKGDDCPKCDGTGRLQGGDRCLRCMGTGVQGAADAKGDDMNAHLDPGSREDGNETTVKKEGDYWIVHMQGKDIKFPVSSGDTERDAIRYARRKLGFDTSRSTGTLMDILRGDSERRAKTVDMLIEASYNLSKKAASFFSRHDAGIYGEPGFSPSKGDMDDALINWLDNQGNPDTAKLNESTLTRYVCRSFGLKEPTEKIMSHVRGWMKSVERERKDPRMGQKKY